MKSNRFVLTVLVIVTLLVCCSCGSTKRVIESVPIETIKEVNIHDTLVIHDVQYDSIYISKDRSSEYHLNPSNLSNPSNSDTLFIKDVSIEYRYKLLRDTVERVKLEVVRDSIPYEVRITETVEVPRPLNWFDHLCRYSFFFILGANLLLLYRFFRKLRP